MKESLVKLYVHSHTHCLTACCQQLYCQPLLTAIVVVWYQGVGVGTGMTITVGCHNDMIHNCHDVIFYIFFLTQNGDMQLQSFLLPGNMQLHSVQSIQYCAYVEITTIAHLLVQLRIMMLAYQLIHHVYDLGSSYDYPPYICVNNNYFN